MHICYVDESGCLGALPDASASIQPVLVVTGLFIDRAKLPPFTNDWLELKSRHFPGLMPHGRPYLDKILAEIKGNEVRKQAASPRRREWRQAIGFLDHLLRLLRNHDCRMVSRVWVKGVGHSFNGRAVYSYSIQDVCTSFQNYLGQNNDTGILIADNRRPAQNRNVSHSIFTQKFKTTGDNYDRLLEMPTFGDSQNHAGLQVCDLLCSAVVQPIAVHSYCTGHVTNIHVRPHYERIRDRFSPAVKQLQHRYRDTSGRWHGGITVHDAIAKRSSSEFFR